VIPDVCAGSWSVERAMVEPRTWLDSHDDKDECEVTPRMIELLRVVLTAIHGAGASRPSVWKGVGSIIVDWRLRWPFGSVHGDRFRRVCIDVEDDLDDFGIIGCVMLESYRDSSGVAAIEGWNLGNIGHAAEVVAGFLRGESIEWAAERLPGCVGEASRPWACRDFASGKYTCRFDPAGWRPTEPPTLPGGVCKETSCPI